MCVLQGRTAQEAIERVNQLGLADRQPELLTFCDRKGRLIGETEHPGVPDIVDTAITEKRDGTKDLIPPALKFLNLRTGKRITRRSWTEPPMPQEVIERVNQLGLADRQPELLTFYDRKGRLIGETEH